MNSRYRLRIFYGPSGFRAQLLDLIDWDVGQCAVRAPPTRTMHSTRRQEAAITWPLPLRWRGGQVASGLLSGRKNGSTRGSAVEAVALGRTKIFMARKAASDGGVIAISLGDDVSDAAALERSATSPSNLMPSDAVLSTVRMWIASVVVAVALVLVDGLQNAEAGEVTGLYSAQVPVSGQSAEDQDAAVASALEAVLVKVSGSASIATHPAVKAAIAQPAPYLQQYRYETQMVTSPGQAPEPRQVLKVEFDSGAIGGLLSREGLPRWSRIRPTMLLWLANDVAGTRELVPPGDPGGLSDAASRAADQRGIPMVLPLLDLEDRANIRATDVWAAFAEPVERASGRYGAEAILVGRTEAAEAGTSAKWTLLLGGVPANWESTGADAPSAVAAGVNGAADRIANRFVQRDTGQSGVRIDIVGVATVEDYARAIEYLRSLDVVETLSVVQATTDRLGLQLGVSGGRDSLVQLIGLGRVLSLEPGDVSGQTFRLLVP